MKQPVYKYVLVFFDIVVVFIALLCSAIVYNIYSSSGQGFPQLTLLYIFFFLFCSFLFIAIFRYFHLYNINVIIDTAEHCIKLMQSLIVATVLLGFFAFFFRSQFITESRLTIVLFFPIAFLIFSCYRILFFVPIFRILTKKMIFSERAIILGGSSIAKLVAANLEFNPWYGLTVIGFVDDSISTDTVLYHSKKILGKINDIDTIVQKFGVHEIIVCIEGITIERLLQILDICNTTKARVRVASPLYGIVSEKIFTEKYGNVPVIDVYKTGPIPFYQFIKRFIDVALATLGLILIFPLMLLVAIAILIESGRPIIFSQTRIGKDGKPFKFYKFRSMYASGEDDSERKNKMREFIKNGKTGSNGTAKIVEVNRITRVGKFIRKTSIDELPQLFNVIKGDMSLVGPRPCLPYEWDQYDRWQKRRLSTIPGCTGVWQVSGRSEVSFNDMVVLDIFYIQNQSILLDLKIILKTIPVMIFGKGGI
jgi:undecaprenyl-phosphate galactose phosphotransferase